MVSNMLPPESPYVADQYTAADLAFAGKRSEGRMEKPKFEPVSRTEPCTVITARRVAAMLDLDPSAFTEGDALPTGWHFILMGADTPRSALRADGFPGLGVSMPDLGLPRLLQGGRNVEYLGEIPIGATVQRTSAIRNLTQKDGASGPMAIVTIGHELRLGDADTPAIVETQTYFLLPAQRRPGSATATPQQVTAEKTKTVVPDETLLFQYSALGFNSHKIHIDKAYARDVEGFPDLVVNGGLSTLLLTEFARRELALQPARFTMKNVAPLFCGRPMTLAANRRDNRWHLAAYDETGHTAAEMEMEVK